MTYDITYRMYDSEGNPYDYTLTTNDLNELAKMIAYIAENAAHMDLVNVEAV